MIFVIWFSSYSVAPLVVSLRSNLRLCCFNHGLGWCDFLGAAGRFLVSLLQCAFRSLSVAGLCWLRLSGSGKPFTASVEVSSEIPPQGPRLAIAM